MANLGIRVKMREIEGAKVEGRVELSGFPDENRFVRRIEEAVVRKSGSGDAVLPVEITPEEIIKRNAALLKLSEVGNQ